MDIMLEEVGSKKYSGIQLGIEPRPLLEDGCSYQLHYENAVAKEQKTSYKDYYQWQQ